jgi:hypothetical protein
MGIDLNCGSEYFGCSYSSWKYFRYNLIAEKVVDYVHNIKKINNIFTYDLQIEFKKYNDLSKNLDNFDLFMKCSDYITFIIMNHKDFLKSLDMDGLVYLINKSDCQGEYTVEESQRILLTIQNIRKHIITDEHEHKDVYDRLIKLFEESVNTNSSVSIS